MKAARFIDTCDDQMVILAGESHWGQPAVEFQVTEFGDRAALGYASSEFHAGEVVAIIATLQAWLDSLSDGEA